MSQTHHNASWNWSMNSLQNFFNKNQNLLNGILTGALLLAAAWYGYSYYQSRQEAAAFTILHECLSEYEQLLQNKGQWADVQAMCQAGYDKYKRTSAGAYILALEVDLLLAQEKKDEALDRLQLLLTAIKQIFQSGVITTSLY